MNIAFYQNNGRLRVSDFSDIMQGNPGIGGTEYEFVLVSYLLDRRDNGLDVTLLTCMEGTYPHSNVVYVEDDIVGACRVCQQRGIDVLVMNQAEFDKERLDDAVGGLSIVLWAHNDIQTMRMKEMRETAYVKRVVYCGREFMELYRDNLLSLKSSYAYNIFPIKDKQWYMERMGDKKNHNVVYMGHIGRWKCFHVLCMAWKDVLKAVPDAQLYVIGGGNLYDRSKTLGRYNIAEEEYEKWFVPYISDEKGNILPSVHFMGVLGSEKFEVMGRCKVGVPNPLGHTETFCICGIEMQLMGCSLTTLRHHAYLDTCYNHSYLYEDGRDLAKYIVKRLRSKPDSYDDLYRFIADKFSVEKTLGRWERILSNVDDVKMEPISRIWYHSKWLKDIFLRLKRWFPKLEKLPPVDRLYVRYYGFRKMMR